MSLYEVVVLVALVGAAGCAYFLYRSDMRLGSRRKSRGPPDDGIS